MRALRLYAGPQRHAGTLSNTACTRRTYGWRRLRPVHLVGASIGAWRMATACLNDPVQAFQRLESDYIRQHLQARISAWSRAVAASQQLAHEWQAWLVRPDMALVDSL